MPHSILREDETATHIGSGGTADCFRVNRHGKWFIMKRLKANLAADVRCRQAMRKEYETGIQIDHPNIVRYHYFEETQEGLCILQDYVDGISLNEFVARDPRYFRDKGRRKRFQDELFSAVACLHAHQVIHLDLKPQNILVTTNGHSLKLIDLGMSFADAFQTTYGGTAGYSAPEVLAANASKPTLAADIYSIGKILALTSCKDNHTIKRCTADDPHERYQSVEDLQRALVSHAEIRKALCALAIFFIVAVPPTLFLYFVDYGYGKKNNESEIIKEDAPQPTSDIEKPMSDIRNPKSDIESSKSDVEKSKSDIEISKSDLGETAPNNSSLHTPRSSLKENSSIEDASSLKLQNELYEEIYKSIDEIYAPVSQLIANPPEDKQEFLNRFYELRAEARDKMALAHQDISDKYHIRLSESQYQEISSKITAIEEKFYVRYNQDK